MTKSERIEWHSSNVYDHKKHLKGGNSAYCTIRKHRQIRIVLELILLQTDTDSDWMEIRSELTLSVCIGAPLILPDAEFDGKLFSFITQIQIQIQILILCVNSVLFLMPWYVSMFLLSELTSSPLCFLTSSKLENGAPNEVFGKSLHLHSHGPSLSKRLQA